MVIKSVATTYLALVETSDPGNLSKVEKTLALIGTVSRYRADVFMVSSTRSADRVYSAVRQQLGRGDHVCIVAASDVIAA